ncbi:MAG: hypothetical protein MO846_06865 [Candidatus Devosia symbiotica]|nr:hypothetical protein [Candidatus Devosia symbiotica]
MNLPTIVVAIVLYYLARADRSGADPGRHYQQDTADDLHRARAQAG